MRKIEDGWDIMYHFLDTCNICGEYTQVSLIGEPIKLKCKSCFSQKIIRHSPVTGLGFLLEIKTGGLIKCSDCNILLEFIHRDCKEIIAWCYICECQFVFTPDHDKIEIMIGSVI